MPPPECTDACAVECLDPTLLLMTDPDCEEYKYSFAPDGGNMTVVSIPYSFNTSTLPECSRNMSFAECTAADFVYYNVTEYERDILVSEGCVRRCAARCIERCFDHYCVTRLEEPINETATCLPRCLEVCIRPVPSNQPCFAPPSLHFTPRTPGSPHSLQVFFTPEEEVLAQYADDVGSVDAGLGGGGVGGVNASSLNLTECQLACHGPCLVHRSSNCSALCEPILEPNAWQACYTGCYANASAVCTRDCVYECTDNHTLAYGFEAPYDATGDYLTVAELRQAYLDHADLALLGGPSHSWSNESEACYSNCTLYCANECFESSMYGPDGCRVEVGRVFSDPMHRDPSVLVEPATSPDSHPFSLATCHLPLIATNCHELPRIATNSHHHPLAGGRGERQSNRSGAGAATPAARR